MKKLNLGKLKLHSNDVLENSQLATVYGGSGGCTYTCYCGFVGGCGENSPFTVTADSLSDALWGAGLACNGRGATCSG
ncbi:hypothetical protein [Algoriphagus resistens]|uniref:hypothetical protein n=1 Tax=Algoriphagus resistens TaxID=1750590 RepID=UPI0012F80B96|nr:hypothetical protein [Algoriphagus resistens]